MSTSIEIQSTYRDRWGSPARTAHFETDGFTIEIWKWPPESNGSGVSLYATVGASNWPADPDHPSHRAEFILGLTPEQDDVASPLAALGLHAARERKAVSHGHTVSAERPLWSGTEMDSFLVLRPREMLIVPLTLSTGEHVEFLQAIPVFRAERRFVAEHGADPMLQRWEAAGVPFWEAHRMPSLT